MNMRLLLSLAQLSEVKNHKLVFFMIGCRLHFLKHEKIHSKYAIKEMKLMYSNFVCKISLCAYLHPLEYVDLLVVTQFGQVLLNG